MPRRWYLYLAMLAALLALGVIVLGAYVRLSQAGLGCPDWPGCYGHMTVPESHQAVAQADARYLNRPLHSARAWKEMIHRYFAGSLTLLILILAIAAWWRQFKGRYPVALPTLALLTVIFQALLGMWTVTLLLFPPVVMGHLLGGYLTFALLVLLVLQTGGWLRAADGADTILRWFAAVALAVLVCQIALGGWTSSNYAGIACPDFPTCQAQWWPPMDFRDAFSWHGLGPDYQGG
ncbi:MAG: COX15/CtaA family protein, partial [Gammaproteobacteria bacterium]